MGGQNKKMLKGYLFLYKSEEKQVICDFEWKQGVFSIPNHILRYKTQK